jgi:hypothetical protein
MSGFMKQVLDWINEPLRGRMRRIDGLLIVAGILCVGYYGYTAGLIGALQGGAMFMLMVMIGLWLL